MYSLYRTDDVPALKAITFFTESNFQLWKLHFDASKWSISKLTFLKCYSLFLSPNLSPPHHHPCCPEPSFHHLNHHQSPNSSQKSEKPSLVTPFSSWPSKIFLVLAQIYIWNTSIFLHVHSPNYHYIWPLNSVPFSPSCPQSTLYPESRVISSYHKSDYVDP